MEEKEFEDEKSLTRPIIPYSSIQIYATLNQVKDAVKGLMQHSESSRSSFENSVLLLSILDRFLVC